MTINEVSAFCAPYVFRPSTFNNVLTITVPQHWKNLQKSTWKV